MSSAQRKLLIITQKVDRNDPVLGFFHEWLVAFAHHTHTLTVICLERGADQLPPHVTVHSLGKERGVSRLGRVNNFIRILLREKKMYDTVFIHMNPEYVLLAGLYWKLRGIPVYLWYVHRHAGVRFRIAAQMVNKIFSVSYASCPARSAKVVPVGHGIVMPHVQASLAQRNSIIHVGRITPIKHCDVLIHAFAEVAHANPELTLEFIGAPTGEKDIQYQHYLTQLTGSLGLQGRIEFRGAVSPSDLSDVFFRALMNVNLGNSGFDKVVLEGLAAGVPTFYSNDAFDELFGNEKEYYKFNKENAHHLAEQLKRQLAAPRSITVLSNKVRNAYSIDGLIDRMMHQIYEP